MKKIRKPRGLKKNGQRALDMCSGCFAFNCDPFMMSNKFNDKIHKRIAMGVCPACGHKPCKCKSSMGRRI
jgi:hypothetical protein